MNVFLDVKLHDIPNTVYEASVVLGSLGIHYLTVHAAGGESMLQAAVRGLGEGATEAGLPWGAPIGSENIQRAKLCRELGEVPAPPTVAALFAIEESAPVWVRRRT
jgi:Orotidine 5'-phosphate decarboxylase / HUMPS family